MKWKNWTGNLDLLSFGLSVSVIVNQSYGCHNFFGTDTIKSTGTILKEEFWNLLDHIDQNNTGQDLTLISLKAESPDESSNYKFFFNYLQTNKKVAPIDDGNGYVFPLSSDNLIHKTILGMVMNGSNLDDEQDYLWTLFSNKKETFENKNKTQIMEVIENDDSQQNESSIESNELEQPTVHKKKRGRPRNMIKEYKCEICDKLFDKTGNYNRHVEKVHKKTKFFKCNQCDKSFGFDYNLKKHMNTVHEEEKKYTCPQCGLKSKLEVMLKSHINDVHLKIKKHKCSICDIAFAQSGTLKQHVKAKHNSK